MNKHFHELMTKYFLGSATEEEFKEFEKLIEENADLRQEYIEQTMIETDMKNFALENESNEQKHQPVERFPRWLAAAIIVLLPILYFGQSAPVVGIIGSSEFAGWESSQPTMEGAELHAGLFKLNSGLSTLKFNTGADVTIEAPATVEVISDMHVRILNGAVSVYVYTDEAKGFRVDTPYGHAIDHGTRFTVKINDEEKTADFEVLEGEISLHHESGKSQFLHEQDFSQMDENDLFSAESIESDMFTKPEKTSVILSSKGNETSVVLNDDMSRLRRGFLLTKRQGERSGMNRRALFAFKLDEANLEDLESLFLSLNYVRNGYAIDMPLESEFELYGISDEQDISTIKIGAEVG